MIDYVNNYLILSRDIIKLEGPEGTSKGFQFQRPRPALTCVSGLVLSVQAGENNHCTPQNDDGPWTTVEIMVQKGKVIILEEWAQYVNGSICSYVPVELINREIEMNGGVKETGR